VRGYAAEYRGGPEPMLKRVKMLKAPENQHGFTIHTYAHEFLTPWLKLDTNYSFTMV
jgi:hypothetical protein